MTRTEKSEKMNEDELLSIFTVRNFFFISNLI